ncbi:gliding motility-associated C-terminal domain-containing protein [Crocinitomicaceae bacterium]|nr:gliding motility-associated C-terminal domain-containing protein [Crocinitomicaceae bacterium]
MLPKLTSKFYTKMHFNTKLLLSCLAFLLISINGKAQTTVCLGTDASVCTGNSVLIQDCNPGVISGTVMASPTNVSLTDDSWSAVVPIGFNFNFYGNTYNQCVIGSNGVVSFNLTNANGYCPWALGGVGTLPSAGFAAALNSMMPAYHDINPGNSPGGSIFYETIGTAPNRRFIVIYRNLSNFGPVGFCADMALVMNETSNSFEFHLGFKSMSPTWNGGLAIQGSQNMTGTLAHITPGRNNTQWTATQDSKMWTPTAPNNTSNYTISDIPYEVFVNGNVPNNLAWANTANSTTWPYNGGDLNVPQAIPGVTGYFLSNITPVACSNNPITSFSDTTFITGVSSSVTATMTDDICSSGQGSVTANPQIGLAPYTFNWPGLGNATTPTVNNIFSGTYTVEMTDSLGCLSTATVVVGDTPATFQGSTTNVSCPGGSDGTAFAEIIPANGTITYQWDDPLSQTTQTATGLSAGTYNCIISSDIGCLDTVTLTVNEIPGMIANIANQIDVSCYTGNDGIIDVSVIQGTPPYTYVWDNSISTTNIANDLVVGQHTLTITDDNGCVISITGTMNEPDPLDIVFITPDTQICPEDDILLSALGSGGSSQYIFTWSQGGAILGTGDQILVDPTVTNTTYCVELSEVCGSPVDNECVLIYFPTPIVPSAIPDETEKCLPGYFEFTNTSTNPGEIASTYWDFGNVSWNQLEVGNDSTSLEFGQVGFHDLTITMTSIFGCVYTDSIMNIVEVKQNPTADFLFTSNPATIFETTVKMQDKSSSDVIGWEWFSPGSNPISSTATNPEFIFPEGIVDQYPVQLAVVTERGCTDTVEYLFNVIYDVIIYAPNTFTPDGDEFNQIWRPQLTGINIYDFDLYIFNRWGELVWETHDPNVGWDGTYDGKIAPDGPYSWRARASNNYNDEKYEFNGAINLIR